MVTIDYRDLLDRLEHATAQGPRYRSRAADSWPDSGSGAATGSGTLLWTHHHHLVHKEHWKIQVKTGVPWFIPPPHIDPRQKPRRNHRQT